MTSYTVRVDWPEVVADLDQPDLAATRADHIISPLADHHAVIGINAERGSDRPWTATLTVDATTPRGAATKAVGLVESATGVPATGFEVLTTLEHDHRAERPLIPDLVGNIEISELLGVTRQRVTQLIDADGFPPAVVTTRAGSLRVRHQVEAWAATWERKSGRPRATTP